MASSSASTPDDYLRELPPDRAAQLAEVRHVVAGALPDGFVETMDFGMIAWVVPLETVPRTYNGKPLMYAGLAAQKNHNALYLMGLYSGAAVTEADLRARWRGGRKPDLGKSCLRFRDPSDLDLGLVAEIVGSCTLDGFVAVATARHARPSEAGG
jgi:hypothetical protein